MPHGGVPDEVGRLRGPVPGRAVAGPQRLGSKLRMSQQLSRAAHGVPFDANAGSLLCKCNLSLMQSMTFDNQVAIVTGAGGGLGRCHALELARRGASVVVNDLGSGVDGSGASTSAAQAVVDEITAAGGIAIANGESVATEEGGAAIVAAAMDAYGRVDILVNNAGILRDAAFKNMTAEQVEAVITVHLSGAFHVTRAVWPVMREQNYGRIVQTTSGTGLFRQFRAGQLRRCENGIGRHDARSRDRGRPQRDRDQRHRADSAHPDDRGQSWAKRARRWIPNWSLLSLSTWLIAAVTAPRTSTRWVPARSRGCSSASPRAIEDTSLTAESVAASIDRDRRQRRVHHPRRTRPGLTSGALESGLTALGERLQALLQIGGARHRFLRPRLLLERPVTARFRGHRRAVAWSGPASRSARGPAAPQSPRRPTSTSSGATTRLTSPSRSQVARIDRFAEHQQFGRFAQPHDSREQVDRHPNPAGSRGARTPRQALPPWT